MDYEKDKKRRIPIGMLTEQWNVEENIPKLKKLEQGS